MQKKCKIFADRLATCKIRNAASALKATKLNSLNETKVVGICSLIFFILMKSEKWSSPGPKKGQKLWFWQIFQMM